ncbi:hypothetical protein [Lysobacter arvi]|uniref:Sel1 repeat family protein n=1 Tax=Lysobacter arvi TaxID=3038776 RepID=A0ABU1CHX9_9GAMM|nr:hypothetical protein [Lysobacter arvi]MDR0184564.1 hypothetical protein [Lysobacter arvi]
METLASILIATALAAGPTAPSADAAHPVIASSDRMTREELDERTRMSANFPNELHRLYGSEAAGRGHWTTALQQFRLAARYADKYSQHRISLMYWHGVGVERDPALAYAWADLAAERLYPNFVVLREKMWMALDETERARALQVGQPLYDEYADEVAKPRLARAILAGVREITGSRTGFFDGRLQVIGPGGGPHFAGDPGNFDLAPMYAGWRRDPARYWAVEDAIWAAGSVEVGDAERAPGR